MVRLDEIGDFVLWQNCAVELANCGKFAGSGRTLVGNAAWRELAERTLAECFESFVWVDKPRWLYDRTYRAGLLNSLRERSFDVVINPTFSRNFYVDDAIVCALRAVRKLGWRGDTANQYRWQRLLSDRFYDELVEPNGADEFDFQKNQSFNKVISGAPSTVVRPQLPELTEPFQNSELSKAPFVAFCLSASSEHKRWPMSRFIELVRKTLALGPYSIVIVGSNDDVPLAAQVRNELPTERVISLAGRTSLWELRSVLAQSQLLVSSDNGVVHMAAAVGTPVIALYNGSHFGRFGPYPHALGRDVTTLYPNSDLAHPDTGPYNFRRYVDREAPFRVSEISAQSVWEIVQKRLLELNRQPIVSKAPDYREPQ